MPERMSNSVRERFPLDAIGLDHDSAEPLFRQLEREIRAAILEGRLRPGDRMPSTRQLASDLSIARNTTKSAYNQLVIEGYLVTAAGSGTHVAQDLPDRLLEVPTLRAGNAPLSQPLQVSAAAQRMVAIVPTIEPEWTHTMRPFRPHAPATDAFPRELWAQLTTRAIKRMSRDLLERVDPRGYHPLRVAVSRYLGIARGVACAPEQVIITAGAQQAIELIAKLFLDPGDTVCMEDPGYTPARILFELAGANVVSLKVDDGGLDVGALSEDVASAKLVYVTPSSQFPLGMTMPLPRRLALIAWARRSGAVILEDDYNGEYRYAGRPLPALYGLAPEGRVLYMGSFSKLLFPALRIGYVVVPPDLAEHFAAARWLADRHSPPLEQAVLANFIEEGHLARHVRRMRTLYAERQTALVKAAEDHLAEIMRIPACDSGLHLVGWLDDNASMDTVLQAAATSGVELTPTSWFQVGKPERESVILGYAPFGAKQIEGAVRALARAYRDQSQQRAV